MPEPQKPPTIEPATVTRPIQLLAAWLVGLILVNSTFLTAAGLIQRPSWAAGALVVSAIANVPIFLICLFFLQTKFRPEMQEDAYYSRYLEHRFNAETGKSEAIPSPASKPVETGKWLNRGEGAANLEIVTREIVVRINDLLDYWIEITNALRASGFIIGSSFGSTSSHPHKPLSFVVVFGRDVPFYAIRQVVEVCSKYGVEGLAIAKEDFASTTVYVGSYAFESGERRYLKTDAELIAAITAGTIGEQELRRKMLQLWEQDLEGVDDSASS